MGAIETRRIRPFGTLSGQVAGKPSRPGAGQHYLRGPVPLDWLCAAARLPGKSLHVGIALWFMAGLLRSSRIPISNVLGGRFGLDRNAKYRALDWLEKGGLVAVERKLGRAPAVTILNPKSTP